NDRLDMTFRQRVTETVNSGTLPAPRQDSRKCSRGSVPLELLPRPLFSVILSEAKDPSAAEPQPTLPYVILSRRSAAKNLRLRSLRSFAVYAAQDDVGQIVAACEDSRM